MRSIWRYNKLLILSLLIVIIAISPVLSSITDTKVISSSGVILDPTEVTPTGGSVSQIQEAINTVLTSGGGTVYIPEGDWEWDQTSSGAVRIDLSSLPDGGWLNIIGSYNNVTATTNHGYSRTMPATILRSSTTTGGYTFYITGSANKHIRISGLAILGKVSTESVNNYGIYIKSVDDFRIDHCYIDSNSGADVLIWMSKGVVDHTQIDQTYSTANPSQWSWGYGIQIAGDSNTGSGGHGTWIQDLSTIQGQYDWDGIPYTAGPIYVEDCTFRQCRHAITSSQYGYYVARHCTFYTPLSDGMPYVEVHGWGFPSGRGVEVYDNTLYGAMGMAFHGGGGVIFDNTLVNCITGIQLSNPVNWDGSSNPQELLDDIWLWNNDFQGGGTQYDVWSNNWQTEGVTYHLSQKQDYTPYQYPHPLTLQG